MITLLQEMCSKRTKVASIRLRIALFLIGCAPFDLEISMQTRLNVATQIFLGMTVVYKDSVVLNTTTFALKAIQMADALIAAEGLPVSADIPAMPAASSPLESDQARDIARDSEELMAILRASNELSQGPGSSLLH